MPGSATTFHLVRHGEHAAGGHVLAGRAPGIGLSARGRAQIHALSQSAWVEEVAAVHTSPCLRTVETATLIGRRAGLVPVAAKALEEVDFGEWTGRTFAELERVPEWRRWNAERERASTPAGETMGGLQARAWCYLEALRRQHPGGSIAIVTHAEVIRALLLAARDWPISRWQRIDVPLASVHRLELDRAPRKVAAEQRAQT